MLAVTLSTVKFKEIWVRRKEKVGAVTGAAGMGQQRD